MDEQSLIAAEHRRRRLSVEGDAAGLEAMMADGFYYAHLNGLTDDRESYLARIRAGEVHYTTMTAHDLDAHLIGSAGWIRGVSRVGYRRPDTGEEGLAETLFLSVWAHEDGGWRIAAYASTQLPAQG
ncbi:DUF4440 domain-containing protein [Sphingomonas histidinilytica]|jgi:hypothetical protein|uniref:DUF4440 domain-containing protein n=1 Tax=Rhizorhabdus histidinilytica TaxID=439228 RepID=A0A1T5FG95_9SPHN|nr:nuclear transport factor 2 family protein [Rhizorhabdus histidinilytica]MBO9375659.1 DUF4440 domain-containing protein [Rhizorhabdus histidinilytica]QEH81101.1 nuclear transport factor 2 family protein [Sphingomonas sp. C8-2]SKB95224.1 protein of unknown function [Rhizorhabdus histidinilytica]